MDVAFARGGGGGAAGGGAAGRGRAAGRDAGSERLRQARSGRDGQGAEERSRADDDEQLLRRVRASRQSAELVREAWPDDPGDAVRTASPVSFAEDLMRTLAVLALLLAPAAVLAGPSPEYEKARLAWKEGPAGGDGGGAVGVIGGSGGRGGGPPAPGPPRSPPATRRAR